MKCTDTTKLANTVRVQNFHTAPVLTQKGGGDVKHVPGYITYQQNLYDIYMRNLFQQLTYWETCMATRLRTGQSGVRVPAQARYFILLHRRHPTVFMNLKQIVTFPSDTTMFCIRELLRVSVYIEHHRSTITKNLKYSIIQ